MGERFYGFWLRNFQSLPGVQGVLDEEIFGMTKLDRVNLKCYHTGVVHENTSGWFSKEKTRGILGLWTIQIPLHQLEHDEGLHVCYGTRSQYRYCHRLRRTSRGWRQGRFLDPAKCPLIDTGISMRSLHVRRNHTRGICNISLSHATWKNNSRRYSTADGTLTNSNLNIHRLTNRKNSHNKGHIMYEPWGG